MSRIYLTFLFMFAWAPQFEVSLAQAAAVPAAPPVNDNVMGYPEVAAEFARHPGQPQFLTIRVVSPRDAANIISQSTIDAVLMAAHQSRIPGITNYSRDGYFEFESTKSNLDALLALLSAVDRALTITIQIDELGHTSLDTAIPLIHAVEAQMQSASGQGEYIVILDSGVDANHPFLRNRVVEEACFSHDNHSATSACPDGTVKQTGATAAQPCPSTVLGCHHGTFAAGIAAGSDGWGLTGVAPDANIIAIQVLSIFPYSSTCGNLGGCARSYTSDQQRALEYVRDVLSKKYSISAVNLSIAGDTKYASDCTADARAKVINDLRALGIPTVISSGNNGYTDGVSAPACVAKAITVGSTHDADKIAEFSNSHALVDVLAPGVFIWSSVPESGYWHYSGTSASAPIVAGAITAIRSHGLSDLDAIEDALKTTGVPVKTLDASVTRRRIDLYAALKKLDPMLP